MSKTMQFFLCGVAVLVSTCPAMAQHGDQGNRKWGLHDGNKIRTPFINYGMISDWPRNLTEYPKGSGHTYLEGATLIIAAEIVDVNGDTVHTVVTNYRSGVDVSPQGIPQTFEPLPGFDNPDGASIAMSHLPEFWPAFWPDRLDDPLDPGWPGAWNGFFGKNAFKAAQESYFVMDDDQDDEFAFFPDSTDSTRRGLGLRVAVRGLQWSEFLAEDILFWHYTITNEGTTDYNKLILAMFFDPQIGGLGDGSDDAVFFNTDLDVVYAFDPDNTGNTGFSPVAYMGFVLLQDPAGHGLIRVVLFPGPLSDDEVIWSALKGENIFPDPTPQALTVIFGSDFFSLNAGETTMAAVALVFGEDFDDLIRNVSFARAFYSGDFNFNKHSVETTFPAGGETLSTTVDITWSASGTGDSLQIALYYSDDDGDTWTLLAEKEPNDGHFTWDTTELPDGIFYRLMVVATNEGGVGMDISDARFTINNAVAAAPQVRLQSPVGNEEITGTHTVTWQAGDSDGEVVTLDVLYSTDSGETFNLISSGEMNDGQFEWDTRVFPNGSRYRIKLIVSDGILIGEDQSKEVFQVNNLRFPLSDFYPDTLGVAHVAGPGTGRVRVHIVEPSALTHHTYEICFDDTSADKTTYDVLDLGTHEFVVLNADEMTPEVEGPFFDGIRLVVDDDPIEVIPDQTRWIAGDANFEMKVELTSSAVPFPADYEIRFFDTIVDTSTNRRPANFTIFNVSDNRKSQFRFSDGNGDGFWSANEFIVIVEMIGGQVRFSWRVTMKDTTTVTPGEPPEVGDIFFIRTSKPFRSGDVFRFPVVITAVDSRLDEEFLPFTFTLSQNYPNPFNPETTIQYSVAVPSRVVIKIYNLLGREVKTLVDEVQEAGRHKTRWHGKDNSGRKVASGLYFYQMKSREFVQTRKLVLVR